MNIKMPTGVYKAGVYQIDNGGRCPDYVPIIISPDGTIVLEEPICDNIGFAITRARRVLDTNYRDPSAIELALALRSVFDAAKRAGNEMAFTGSCEVTHARELLHRCGNLFEKAEIRHETA